MRKALHLFALCFCLLAAGQAAAEEAPLVRAELLTHAPAGPEAWAAVRLTMRDGWHTYWRNPGDSGLATKIEWQLPAGVKAGELQWPAPRRFAAAGMASYGYDGEVVLPVALELPAGDAFPIEARVSWLACDDEACIPGRATVSGTLRRGATSPAVERTLARLPAPAPKPVALRIDGERLLLDLPAESPTSAAFFPHDGEAIDHGAPQRLLPGRPPRLELRRSPIAGAARRRLEGVLLLVEGGAERVFAVRAVAGVTSERDGAGSPAPVDDHR